MKGDLVLIRAYGDKPVLARVWDMSAEAIFICSEENYQKLSAGLEGLMPVGFKRQDVFEPDTNIVSCLRSGKPVNLDWNALAPWIDRPKE